MVAKNSSLESTSESILIRPHVFVAVVADFVLYVAYYIDVVSHWVNPKSFCSLVSRLTCIRDDRTLDNRVFVSHAVFCSTHKVPAGTGNLWLRPVMQQHVTLWFSCHWRGHAEIRSALMTLLASLVEWRTTSVPPHTYMYVFRTLYDNVTGQDFGIFIWGVKKQHTSWRYFDVLLDVSMT